MLKSGQRAAKLPRRIEEVRIIREGSEQRRMKSEVVEVC